MVPTLATPGLPPDIRAPRLRSCTVAPIVPRISHFWTVFILRKLFGLRPLEPARFWFCCGASPLPDSPCASHLNAVFSCLLVFCASFHAPQAYPHCCSLSTPTPFFWHPSFRFHLSFTWHLFRAYLSVLLSPALIALLRHRP